MNELQPINKTIQGKSDIEAYARAEISAALEEGEMPVLELRRQAVMLSELSKRLMADDTLREACISELEKYGSREDVTLCGARFRIGETGVSYDYAPCGDPVHARLIREKQAIDAKLKEREKFLQRLPAEGVETIDEETGEITRIYPPARSSKTSVIVTLPR